MAIALRLVRLMAGCCAREYARCRQVFAFTLPMTKRCPPPPRSHRGGMPR